MSIFLTFAACAEEPINDIETSTENAILTSLSNEDVNDFVWRNDEDVFIFNADSILYKTDIEFNSSSKIFEHTIDQCILTNDSIVYSIDDGDYSKVYKSDLHGKKSKILFQEKGWVYLLDITGHFLYYTNTDFNGDEGKTGLFELNLRSNKSRHITNDSDVYKISKQKMTCIIALQICTKGQY